jgi:sugar/nucleoside kinase (ribokinase family)
MDQEPYILVLGASVVDIFGFCREVYQKFDSIPGEIKMSFGGVCRNISENLAKMGVNTRFISVLGDDETGREMLDHAQSVGYDMTDSLILKNGRTPTYLAILDEHGEMVSGINDMASIQQLDADFIDSKQDIIMNSEYTFLDADNPDNLKHILTQYEGTTKFVLDPISVIKAKKIKDLIGHFHTIKPNRHEAEILAGFRIQEEKDLIKAANVFLKKGVQNIFITLDSEGVFYANREKVGKIVPQNPEVINVTGAGDSFVAGIGYGYMNNKSIEETVKIAVTMSLITISHHDTINPEMSVALVKKVIKDIKWKDIKYNQTWEL